MSVRSTASGSPTFDRIVDAVMRTQLRPEVHVEELPAPPRIAPYALALSAEVTLAGEELGNGRLVLLHDPDGNPTWGGDCRCVTFATAQVDPEMVADPLLAEVGWTWLIESLDQCGARYLCPSGTVTSSSSQSFGGKADEPPSAEVEIRASWTPVLPKVEDIALHLMAWSELLCQTAGLPPLPDGVIIFPAHRQVHRP